MAVEVEVATSTEVGARRGAKRWQLALAGVVVVIVLAVGWWYVHSAAAFDVSSGAEASVTRTTAGTPYSIGVTGGDLPSVTVTRARVILAEGSGPAAVSAVVCDLGSVGVTAGPLTPFATRCRDLVSAELGGLPDTAQIIVTVVPLERAAVEVTGLRVEFQHGWRQGSQTLPVRFTVAAPT